MTESEAIIKHIEENDNRIENIKFFMSSNHDANIDDCKSNIEILIVSNKALEKHIPKKLVRIRKIKQFDGYDMGNCPVCGEPLDNSFYENLKYCFVCGQAIDWSDEE